MFKILLILILAAAAVSAREIVNCDGHIHVKRMYDLPTDYFVVACGNKSSRCDVAKDIQLVSTIQEDEHRYEEFIEDVQTFQFDILSDITSDGLQIVMMTCKDFRILYMYNPN